MCPESVNILAIVLGIIIGKVEPSQKNRLTERPKYLNVKINGLENIYNLP